MRITERWRPVVLRAHQQNRLVTLQHYAKSDTGALTDLLLNIMSPQSGALLLARPDEARRYGYSQSLITVWRPVMQL